MVVEPKVRGFICTTAHPEGCAKSVMDQVNYIEARQPLARGPKKVLVIGASTGYGLASRIAAAFGAEAQTIGVFFERTAMNDKRTASAGWYNTVAFEKAATQAGLYAKSINGDAFSDEIKQQTIDLIKQDWQGGVDLVIYSLASPRRTDPKDGQTYQSVLKPIGQSYTNKTIDFMTGEVSEVSLEAATPEEIEHTVKVMGGEDWSLWIEALLGADCLAEGAKTIAFSYIGPELTFPIYRHGSIGKAKEHLEHTADVLNELLAKKIHGGAYVSVNKGLVTQASSAIPVVPLYISLLYKVMKEQGVHEGCIEQIWRLFADRLYREGDVPVDENRRIRIDDWEMGDDIQAEVQENWKKIDNSNLEKYIDLAGYRSDFYNLFGFGHEAIDYKKDTPINLEIPSITVADKS